MFLNSFRSLVRAPATQPHRSCSIRLGCGMPERRVGAPVMAPMAPERLSFVLSPKQIDEAYRQLKKADEGFKIALIQLSVAKQLLEEAQQKRSDGRADLMEEIQANLMKNFCFLLAEKENKRLRSFEKHLYHGPLSGEEMVQRRMLREQQIHYPLKNEEAMFIPTAEIASAQQMAYDQCHKKYNELYQAHDEAFKITAVVEEIIERIKEDLTKQKIKGNMLEIAPGGALVPNLQASVFLDKMNQLINVIVKLSKLEQFFLSARSSENAQKIDIEFAKQLQRQPRLSEHQYEIQAWNAVLDQLIKNRKWKERRQEINQHKDDIKKTRPRVYAIAKEILTQIKVAYGRGGTRMVNQCIPDLCDQIRSYADIEENHSSGEDEEKR